MKRNLLAGLTLSLLVSAPVFAQSNGIGHAGSYQTQPTASTTATGGKTRAEVQAELGRRLSRRLAAFAQSHDVSEQRPDRPDASRAYRAARRREWRCHPRGKRSVNSQQCNKKLAAIVSHPD